MYGANEPKLCAVKLIARRPLSGGGKWVIWLENYGGDWSVIRYFVGIKDGIYENKRRWDKFGVGKLLKPDFGT